ncbi:hypothetical protein BU23DRAFT_599204 [Bimuria novae-zelandiae CBS 107.79]|uniref:AAA+ ATPase domain-containing protein n=1 Tax=Bimuria novae-zelandiae CBS 107.79 TaxID=1447943 RepID=A0A6A5V744_9PLEO|nr:hypothetical protein BU23DRAFT_599204 [Bimuria novae-zelandiae CBS 107.79]
MASAVDSNSTSETDAAVPQARGSQTPTGPGKDEAASQTPDNRILTDIEALKRQILELEARQTGRDPAYPPKATTDSKAQAEVEQYKRMEACLYKHRKEWETNVGPGEWKFEYNFFKSNHCHLEAQDWPTCDKELKYDDPKYERPDIFDSAHQFGKTFEWQMDRLFLSEELDNRKREEAKIAEEKKRRERRMAESSIHGTEDQKQPPVSTDPETAKLDVAWSEWYPFQSQTYADGKSAPVVNILIGEPPLDENVGTNQYWFGASSRRLKKDLAHPSSQISPVSTDPSSTQIPERIRIHSDALLRIFATILNTEARPLLGLKDMTAVFLRPYKALFYREQALRDWCKALERKFKKWVPPGAHPNAFAPTSVSSTEHDTEPAHTKALIDSDGSGNDTALPLSGSITEHSLGNGSSIIAASDRAFESENEDDAFEGDDKTHDLTRSATALSHLQCLLRFLDVSVVAKRNYLNDPKCRKVFFSDLWHVFRPGVEIIGSDDKQACKVIGTTVTVPSTGSSLAGNAGPVSKRFDFDRFDGQRDITSLEVYLLRFHPLKRGEVNHARWEDLKNLTETERYRQELILRGAQFLEVSGGKHMYYAGMTLDAKDEVESPVVIDFETTFTMHDKPPKKIDPRNQYPPPPVSNDDEMDNDKDPAEEIWKPKLGSLIGMAEPPTLGGTDCNGECCREEFVHDDQYVGKFIGYKVDIFSSRKEELSFAYLSHPLSTSPLFKTYTDFVPAGLADRGKARMFGQRVGDHVVSRLRVHPPESEIRSPILAKLHLAYLSDIHTTGEKKVKGTPSKASTQEGQKQSEPTLAFNRLALERGHHSMLVSIIAQLFRDKKSKTGQREEFDIVKGKGKGLIILPHGAPGVGKTSTAEGVAELFKKPLFQITCGDLGTTATEVETALEKNFSLANNWDCIVLLDEADVFLAERTKEDFKRNGLVAVFLRLMEYYSGILFLTTNRVGDFDEAFTSRIHVSLYYPELNEDTTVRVFELNMDMIEERFETKGRIIKIDRMKIGSFAARYFADHPHARWNGRHIHNACQTALALAEFEAQDKSLEDTEDPDIVVNLTVENFQVVRDAYLEFTKYINELHGTNAACRAKEVRLRAIWIDENDCVVKTQNMDGAGMDKRQAFFLAAQSQPSRAQGHSPQHSLHHPFPQQQGRYQQSYQRPPYQQQERDSHQNWDPQPDMYSGGYIPEPQQHGVPFQGSSPRAQQATPSPHPHPQQQQQGRLDMPQFKENIRDMYEPSGRPRDDQVAGGASGPSDPFEGYRPRTQVDISS